MKESTQVSNFEDQLTAPVKSFRLFAIEQIISTGAGDLSLLDTLSRRLAEETDEECLLLLKHAITEVHKRLEKRDSSTSPEFHPDEFRRRFADTRADHDSAAKSALLAEIPPHALPILASSVPDWLEAASDPGPATLLIRKFQRLWPRDRLSVVGKRLFSPSLMVRLAALDCLLAMAPQALEKELPRLLLSDEPRTRALAIRGLAALDLDEAVEHLKLMLESDVQAEKFSALQNSFYLPFERIKPLLLNFLVFESDLSLIHKAGILLQANPDTKVPFRLLEIMEQTHPERQKEKHAALQTFFEGSCQAIFHSGMAEADHVLFRRHLQEYSQKRSEQKRLQKLLSLIQRASDPGSIDFSSGEFQDFPPNQITLVLEQTLQRNLPSQLREKVIAVLAGLRKRAVESALPASGVSRFSLADLSVDEKAGRIGSWQPEDRDQAAPLIAAILAKPQENLDLTAVSLRTAARCGLNQHIGVAQALIDQPHEKCAGAALEYLAKFAPDDLLPRLGSLLQSSNPRLRAAGIGVLRTLDLKQAIRMVTLLLSSRLPLKQEIGLACLVHFDFAVIREPLLAFLKTAPAPDLLRSGLSLYFANPLPENLYDLWVLAEMLPAGHRDEIIETRKQNETMLLEMGVLQSDQLQALQQSFAERFAEEKRKRSAPPHPCSVRVLRPSPVEPKVSWQELFDELRQQLTWQVALLFLVLVLVSGWSLATSSQRPTGLDGPPQSFSFSSPQSVAGVIRGQDQVSGHWIFETNDGSRFLFSSPPGVSPESNGRTWKAVFIPFQFSRGYVFARCQSLDPM